MKEQSGLRLPGDSPLFCRVLPPARPARCRAKIFLSLPGKWHIAWERASCTVEADLSLLCNKHPAGQGRQAIKVPFFRCFNAEVRRRSDGNDYLCSDFMAVGSGGALARRLSLAAGADCPASLGM